MNLVRTNETHDRTSSTCGQTTVIRVLLIIVLLCGDRIHRAMVA